MYTAVLVLALTAGAESANHCRGRCSGCSAYSCSRCYSGCSGCYSGCYGCAGTTYYAAPSCCGCSGYVVPAPVVVPTPPAPEKIPAPAPGTVMVNLPAEARLTFDGYATRATGESRAFVTTPLQYGRSYSYVVRVELMSNGQPIVETRQVTVRAGQTSMVQFNAPPAGIAAGR